VEVSLRKLGKQIVVSCKNYKYSFCLMVEASVHVYV